MSSNSGAPAPLRGASLRCLARRRFLWLLLPGPPLGTPLRRLSAARRAPKFVSLPDTLWLLLPPSPVALLCSGCSSRAWRFRRTSPLLERAGVNLPRGPSVLGLLPGAQARRLDCSCFYRRLWVVSNSGTACLRGCGARVLVLVCGSFNVRTFADFLDWGFIVAS